jgi:flagellar motor protein MotB
MQTMKAMDKHAVRSHVGTLLQSLYIAKQDVKSALKATKAALKETNRILRALGEHEEEQEEQEEQEEDEEEEEQEEDEEDEEEQEEQEEDEEDEEEQEEQEEPEEPDAEAEQQKGQLKEDEEEKQKKDFASQVLEFARPQVFDGLFDGRTVLAVPGSSIPRKMWPRRHGGVDVEFRKLSDVAAAMGWQLIRENPSKPHVHVIIPFY